MNRYLPLVPVLGIVTTITLQSQPVFALERAEIAAKAKEFTVQIEGKLTGTGTIIQRDGNSYTILTCWHVVNEEGSFEVTTIDGATHRVAEVKNLPDVDLAVIKFTSNTSYKVAELGNSQSIIAGTSSYIVGYPDPIPGIPERAYMFLDANIVSKLATGEYGYQIVHSNPTTGGSSGGGIFDDNGRLVGINGRTTSDETGRTAYGLGIPLQVYLAARNNFAIPTNIDPPQDFVSVGRRKLNQKDYRGAIEEFNQALASNPNDLDALSGRGEAYYWLKDFPAVIKDFDDVLRQNPNDSTFLWYRAYAHDELGKHHKAISDYDEAIRIDSDNASLYNSRGISYSKLGEYDKAIADYNEALRLDPNFVEAYNNRGSSYINLGEYDKAITDYSEVIRLDSQHANAYYGRGYIYQNLGDNQRAVQDFQQAADLYQQQGNTGYWYQEALDRIRELQ
ncbi:tetratricopeptide repeat protein [Xenococcus sp. PCC 7305]|uniref:tetratricopeptide repeat-containing S1 family peptidase n=1 Tax=Xenococcus sp. PCC 7305 TaxID=102125 RepID=UPI0002ABE67E|nr:tetratricopeptide repeat-containing serine protease family protein [Xenococcus sp. PCC 7305]ELS00406.1 tetratricopeptide repeat protein [Xenococcus sp. PCC 7305]